MTDAIAIVGMACEYPEASSPLALWQNILSKRIAFRQIPADRLNLADYTQDEGPDSIYLEQAALLTDYTFDRVKFRISGTTYRSVDLVHWLALDVANRALADAGFPDAAGLMKESTGVLVGNTLNGEFSRANSLRLRWPYVQRQLNTQLLEKDLTEAERVTWLNQLEQMFKSPFTTPNEETLAGALSNTIAGRICNYFNLGGGGYCLDGACSSSLLAVANACSNLRAGDLDTAIIGGVDLSLDPFELVGFSRTGAFAHNEMRVYDEQGTGFLPGEGCGFMVLMRHEDALAQGLRYYALIRGWGISSDGGGGITRPESHGQRLAIQRAYQRAGYDMVSVPLFEGHGTGTAVGDTVELTSLNDERTLAGAKNQAIISSVKANIGHTKAAAGIAGLIKATMALHTQVLPPATNIKHLHPELSKSDAKLTTLSKGKIWPQEKPLRAGVSSFGFGGINVHIALENHSVERRTQLTVNDERLINSEQDAELFIWSALTYQQLLEQLQSLEQRAIKLSHSEISDCAIQLAKNIQSSATVKAAIVANSPKQLSQRITWLIGRINNNNTHLIDENHGVFLWPSAKPGTIAFLFPGQAAPIRKNGGALANRFKFIRDFYASLSLPSIEDPQSTALVQPAIVAAELSGLLLMEKLSIHATAVLGHSLGELTALHWAGAYSAEEAMKISTQRGKVMAQAASQQGAMASISADKPVVNKLLVGLSHITIACFNSPLQTIVTGSQSSIEAILRRAQARSLQATRLPVSQSFHSPYMREAANLFATHLESQTFSNLSQSFVSSVTGKTIDKQQNLKTLLIRQLTQPVHFIDAFKQLDNQIDCLLEVGPGKILAGLAKQQSKTPCISLDIGSDSLFGLLSAMAACHVLGIKLNQELLFYNRFSRPIDLQNSPTFLTNPCEKAPPLSNRPVSQPKTKLQVPENSKTPHTELTNPEKINHKDNITDLLINQVANRLELPIEAISLDNRLLVDLHLNSIAVGQLVTDLSRQLNLPAPAATTDYANATLRQVSQALEDLKSSGVSAKTKTVEKNPPGVDAWVRTFQITYQNKPLPDKPDKEQKSESHWQLHANVEKKFNNKLIIALQHSVSVNGVLLVLSDDLDRNIVLLLKAAKVIISNPTTLGHFVLVQSNNSTHSMASFARTFFQEQPDIKTTIIALPLVNDAIPRIVNEIRSNASFVEARYDQIDIRQIPALMLVKKNTAKKSLPLGNTDVVLVSGGGKGIAAECALQLAKKTGSSLVLLGRAKADDDKELSNNLIRFTKQGCQFLYFSVDVTDQQKVAKIVQQAQQKLGPISAIIHGAGVNHPCLINHLSQAMFHQTLATKLQGAENLLAAIDASQLRLFVAFSSIIARTGMRGEADYAVANQQLSLLTEKLQQDYPACRCLSLEWSVWSGVGMGERLGRIDALIAQGISPISPDKGVDIFLDLISQKPPKTSLVISGRLGEIETLTMTKPDLPFQRFLEQTRVFYPGVELIIDVELSLASDLYLQDHQVDGEYLFPAVMGMEAMAQVATALFTAGHHNAELTSFSDINFLRPIVVPADEPMTLRIAALINIKGDVDLILRSSRNGFTLDHFKGKCHFSKKSMAKKTQLSNSPCISLNIEHQIYNNLLFHQGRFQRINGYQHLHTLHCQASIDVAETTHWYSNYLPQPHQLADPGARDAAIHAIQACIPHVRLLPISVDHIEFFSTHTLGPWQVHAKQQWQNKDVFCYNLSLFNAEGYLLERWTGLALRKVANIKVDEWVEPLLVTYLERRSSELIPGAEIQIALRDDQDMPRQQRSSMAISEASGIIQTAVIRRPDGKPELTGQQSFVSASHHAELTLAASSAHTVSCDIECVIDGTKLRQQDVVGDDWQMLTKIIAKSAKETIEISATRLWVVRECLKKAGLLLDTPIVLSQCHKDDWVLFTAGENKVATYLAKLKNRSQPMMIGILIGANNEKL